MAHRWLVIFLCIAFPAAVSAQADAPVPVVLRHAGVDPVGQALIAALRDELAASPGFHLQSPEEAAPRIVLIVATVDGSVEDPEKQTAASVSVTYDADALPLNGYLITALVQVCGITRTRECALEILETVAAAVARLQAEAPELSLSPPQP